MATKAMRQNSAKIIRNVFKKGDAYFNSGDLFTVDFVYFADRIGDTFRYHSSSFASLIIAVNSLTINV